MKDKYRCNMSVRLTSILFIILMAFTVMFGISCTNEVAVPQEKQIEKPLEKKEEEKTVTYDMDGGEAQVIVGLHMPWDDGKSLSSNHDNTYQDFLLTTKYLSERRDGSTITGEFTDLRLAANGDGGRNNVDLGWFTQGKWLFSVKAANNDGDILYVGSWEGYVSAAATNSIVISMEENAEDVGYLAFDIASITVPLPRIVVTYSKIWNGSGEHLLLDTGGDGRGLTMTNNKDGYTFYRTPNLTLPAGAYALKVQLWSGEDLFSGEVLDTYIVPRKTSTIEGVFTITGLANFIRVTAGQTLKFTEACQQIEIESGKMVTGFHRLGMEELVDFPYTNDTDELQYLVPQIEDISAYFTISNGVVSGTGYPYRYLGFNYGFADSPREIAANTFKGISSARTDLRAFYSPDTVTIGADAFAYTNLDDTYFGTLDSIGDRAFKGSTIPELDNSRFINTVTIGSEAFRYSGLKYIDVPSGAKLGTYAFADCTAMYRSSCLVRQVSDNCYSGCTSLSQMTLENTESIGTGAFTNCSALKELLLPDTLTTISARAFDGCSGMLHTFNIPAKVTTIGANAFRGMTGLYEIYLNAVCGDIAGEPWGAPCNITWWAYKLFLNSNLPADYVKAEGEEEFPQLTEKNGILLKYPIPDPKYRLIAYNDVVGATLDGYPIPIPVIDGYALRGWFTDPAAGDEITQLTVNTRRENWTVYAHWVRGLITVVFQGGRGGDSNTGIATETYRMVRYQGYYGYVGEEDEKDDWQKPLPTAKIDGRNFIGWYLDPEPMLDETSPDETEQAKMYRIVDTTQVETKKSHTLYAHYRDHRYTVQFNANLPSNAGTYGTRNGTNVSSSYTVPSSYTVVYNQPYNKAWDPKKSSSSTYRGVTQNLPDLNAEAYKLDNYWFVGWYLEPECINRVFDSTKVAAQASDGATITLYAKWIGKEKDVNLISRYKADPEDADYTQKNVATFKARFTAPHTATNAWRSYFNKSVVSEREIERDQSYSLPTINASTNGTFYNAGYTFNGWYTGFSDASNSVTGTQILDGKTFGTSPTEVTTPGTQNLYAKWTPNTYTVTFNAMGGSVGITSKTVTYHTKYGELPIPTRPGYIFTGWYTDSQRELGYGYQNSPAYMTADSYVRTVGNHTLYAGWSGVTIVLQSSTSVTPLNTTLTFKPTSNGGYYGSGTSNVGVQTVALKTVMDAPTTGVLSGGKWANPTGVVAMPNQPVSVVLDSTGYVSSVSNFTTDSSGNATFSVVTTDTAIPGTSIVTLKTVSSGITGQSDGIINVALHGKLTGITVEPASTNIYLRNSVTLKASLVSSEGNLHASNCGISWTHTAPDTYSQVAPGADASTGWVVPGTAVATSGVTSNVTFKAGYEIGSATVTAKSTAVNLATKPETSASLTLVAPPNTLQVNAGSSVGAFLDNVATLYGSSATAKAQWLVTGFRDWEGGDPAVASNSTANSRAPGWTNNTGHKVYLFPIVPAVYTAAGSQAGAVSNSYIAFPTNVTTIGTYPSSNPGDGYGDYKSATKVYIAGSNCTVAYRAFASNGNDCEFRIAGSISTVRPYGFYASSGVRGITSANFRAMKTIGESAFESALHSSYNHAVDLGGCTSLGSYAFRYSKITSVSTPITAQEAFRECSRLTTVSCNAGTIARGAFYYCGSLSTVSLSNTTSILAGAFRGCTALRSISFPSTLNTLEDHTAWNSSGCFEGSGLTSVNLSGCSGLGTIGSACFYGCTGITSVSFHNNLNTIGSIAFYNTRINHTITFGSNVRTLGDGAFKSNVSLPGIKFNTGSTITLGTEAFYGCSSLTTVDFIAMGSNFNRCSFSTAGNGVWGGCKLRHIKVTQDCFSSYDYTISSNGRSMRYFKVPVLYLASYSNCSYWWPHNSWCNSSWTSWAFTYGYTSSDGSWRYNAADTYSKGGGTNSGPYSYGIWVYGFGLRGDADGWHNGGWESSSEEIHLYRLGHGNATTVYNKIKATGYAFAGGATTDYQGSPYNFTNYCNSYVYPNQLDNLIPIAP